MKRTCLVLPVSLLLVLALTGSALAAPKSAGPGLPLPKVAALLELQHPRGLNRFVRAVSDPTSPRYREYATVEELVDRFGAKPETAKRTLTWLAAHGVHGKLSPTRMFVTAELRRRQAAALLTPTEGATASRVDGRLVGRVPAGLRGAVSGVVLTTESAAPAGEDAVSGPPAPGVRALAATKDGSKGESNGAPFVSIAEHSGTAGGCAAGSSGGVAPGLEPFTPNQYLTAYGHAALQAQGFKGRGQTVAVVEQGGFVPGDIATYAKCFGVEPPPMSVAVVGPAPRPAAEDETTLDLEQLTVGAPGLDHIYVYEAPESLEAIVVGAGAALGNSAHRPDVISISLGICEPQIQGALSWRNALDNVFAVAAGSGISVLVSSGDQGSSGCRAVNLETEETTAFGLKAVSLPASSPYATAVGGTNLTLSKANHIKEEVVWNDAFFEGKPVAAYGGGGGISIITPRTPWWQTGVRRYGPGRKVPDISALADRFPGYAFYCTAKACVSGEEPVPGWGSVGGTSAAAPLAAAGIALANQYAVKHGEPTLGFLNPLIYRLGDDRQTRASAFFDVTAGNDNISRALDPNLAGVVPVGCCQARAGYDWASGWGSLKFAAFAKLAVGAAR